MDLLNLLDDPEPVDTVELCAGPGGWGEGARILGVDLRSEGIEINRDAVATARAAGHRRRLADVTRVDPAEYEQVTGLIASSPCPTFSDGGKRSGRGDDYQHVLDVWTGIGWGIPWREALADLHTEDPRTALLAITGVWAMVLPNLEWFAMEQVPAVGFAWEDLAAEFLGDDWYVNATTVDAQHFGAPSRRERSYIVARRNRPTGWLPFPGATALPAPTMAEALGWDAGHRMNTRGERKTSGGNWFSCDRPSWCLTGKARSWVRDDGATLTPGQAGRLTGFREDYPWTGSRTSQFQQAGDVMAPIMGAWVLGAALGIDARPHVERHLTDLYGTQFATAA